MHNYLRADLKYASRWFFSALLALALFLLLALYPAAGKVVDDGYTDKIAHAFGCAGLMILFCGPLTRRAFIWVFLLLAVCGGMIEILQQYIPGRAPEWGDIYANLTGLAVASMLVYFGLGDWCQWLEKRLVGA